MTPLQRDALAAAVAQLRESRDAVANKWYRLESMLYALGRCAPGPNRRGRPAYAAQLALDAEALEYDLTGEANLVPAVCEALGLPLPSPSTPPVPDLQVVR